MAELGGYKLGLSIDLNNFKKINYDYAMMRGRGFYENLQRQHKCI